MLGSCRGLIRLNRVPPSCCLCLCCWSKRTSGGTEELPPETHEFTHTHATQDTLQHMHYTLFEGWVLVMQIPSGEKWSQSESRWEVRPGVQALHLSSVIKTGTLGCSHPIEEKKLEREGERGSADRGMLPLGWESCGAWLTPAPCPIYTYLWNA